MQDSGTPQNRFAVLAKYRNALFVLSLAVLVAGWWLFPMLRDSAACSETSESLPSPGGEYRAMKLHRVCTWGGWLGASNTTELQVSMLSKPSWTRTLLMDGDADIASFKWKSANVLEVRIYSRDIRGVITRRIHELAVIYRYLKPPKNTHS